MTSASVSMATMATALLFFGGLVAIGFFFMIAARERALIGKLNSLLANDRIDAALWARLLGTIELLGRKIAAKNEVNGELRNLLAAAGFYKSSSVYIFLFVRLCVAFFVFVVAVLLDNGFTSVLSIAIGAAFAFLFFRYSLIVVRYVGERRAASIQRELPSVLDIVLMVLDSGVSIDQCLEYVSRSVRRSAPTVAPILKKHISDVATGTPYDQALTRLGQRLVVPEGVDFANMLKQAMFQGGELAPSLKRFVEELSDRRMTRARSEGGRRATYLTMVMVAFFVPVLLVVLVGPAFVNVAGTIQAAAHRMHSK